MRRREFITLVGGVAATWPVVGRAQQAKPVIGFLSGRSSRESASVVAAFHRGLEETGYIDGRNVAIEFRWADGEYARLPALAAELVGLHVDVIATSGGAVSALAAKAATTTIPIVFSGGSDPISAGLVASLNRPGGNVTGALDLASELTAKRLEIVRAMAPVASAIGVFRNPAHREAKVQLREIQDAARDVEQTLHIANVSNESEFGPALAGLIRQRVGALLVASDPFFATHRERLIALVARHAIPAIFAQRQYAEAGGLMSYGTNFSDMYRQVGAYTGRVLKGEKPSDLPVVQPTKYELIINLKTAKSLGRTVPDKLIALADEVIE